jgi:hypothetical protein
MKRCGHLSLLAEYFNIRATVAHRAGLTDRSDCAKPFEMAERAVRDSKQSHSFCLG